MSKSYRLTAVLQIEVEIPTANTLEFLIEEDLSNLGYEIGEIKTLDFKRSIRLSDD